MSELTGPPGLSDHAAPTRRVVAPSRSESVEPAVAHAMGVDGLAPMPIPGAADVSVFALVRDLPQAPRPMTLTKATLVALSHALEDECLAGTSGALLLGTFQQERFFGHARRRWSDLSATTRLSVAFARIESDPESVSVEDSTALVPIASGSPLLREWTVVIDAVPQPGLLTAWELPGQDGVPDADRAFDALWSLRPAFVRSAVRVLATRAAAFGVPEAAVALQEVEARPLPTALHPGPADRIYARVVGALDAMVRDA